MSKRKPKSETAALDATKLPRITPKQMRFVELLLTGMTATEAYRQAFDASEMAITTIYGAASALRRSPKVDAWIRAAYVAHLTTGVITKDEHVRELGAIRELSKEQGDLKSAVAAEHLRGKVSGFYVERSEHTVYDPAAVLAQIAAIDRNIAASLAARFNLALPAIAEAAEPVLDLVPIPAPARSDQSSDQPEPDPLQPEEPSAG